jgi:pilus assembly protein Flp/PilA
MAIHILFIITLRRYVIGFAYDMVAWRERILRISPRPEGTANGSSRAKVSHVRSHPPISEDESGATAIEYGLIAAGISVAIIAVVNGLGTNLNAKFKSISTQLK